MKVTVLGGSGFLGSHVADHLTRGGHDVTIFDRDVSRWLGSGQSMIVGDIKDLAHVVEATRGSEVVYNFAAIADLDEARSNPIESALINVIGNLNALEASRIHSVKRFVLASSLYVNSVAGSFYRCSKQSAEHYVEEYWREFALPYTILRFGSLYGPRSGAGNGLRQIIRGALTNGRVRYAGSPDATREYIHVEDAASAATQVLDEHFANRSVMLSGQQSIRVDDLLATICEMLQIPPSSAEFVEVEDVGRYVRTPYSHHSQISKKLVPTEYVDFGLGLLELIRDVEQELNDSLDG